MSNNRSKTAETSMTDEILAYISMSSGLSAILAGEIVTVTQEIDGKMYKFNMHQIGEVIHRKDIDNHSFIQINFKENIRVLFTDSLVGFKPINVPGLDMGRLPKVVTTPDLKVVFNAIEEALGNDNIVEQELEILKKLYLSILMGAEKSGFVLEKERFWHRRLLASKAKALA